VDRGDLWVDVAGPGRGARVLLVAGGGGAAWGWNDLLHELAEAQVACRVARFDQAAVGRSVGVEPAMSVEAYARDCLAVGRTVLGEQFGVIGVSLGGAAALRMAVLAPSTVSWLVVGCAFTGVSTFVGANHR
jgi:pimeloyl-ACP methyl ester carboxylesterase